MRDLPTICMIVGTRPEAIKMAPLYRTLSRSTVLRPVMLSTGQHRHMLDQALEVFGIKPDHDLGLMRPAQSLSDLTSKAITAIFNYLEDTRPAAVLVQGDTTSVLAGALAAFYKRIPVGHVEAGLRSGNMNSPWPEEMNRRLVSPLCQWNFAPTETSRRNLLKEQIDSDKCYVTGNTVVDALLWAKDLINERQESPQAIASRIGIAAEFQRTFFGQNCGQFLLVTGHRRESFGSGFESICRGLRDLVERNSSIGLVFPVHLNPAVRGLVSERLGNHPRIALIEPVSYLDMIWLVQKCRFIISDSGGIQEEAPSLAKPVLITRDNTERPEGVDAGTCRLVGTDAQRILSESELLLDSEEYAGRCKLANPYGDGKASERIAVTLEQCFSLP
jgi:UDP-N-acetylglucosamine 2-epimerase